MYASTDYQLLLRQWKQTHTTACRDLTAIWLMYTAYAFTSVTSGIRLMRQGALANLDDPAAHMRSYEIIFEEAITDAYRSTT